MGMSDQGLDIGHAVACRYACTELWRTDIHGICTMVDGGNALFQILCR